MWNNSSLTESIRTKESTIILLPFIVNNNYLLSILVYDLNFILMQTYCDAMDPTFALYNSLNAYT